MRTTLNIEDSAFQTVKKYAEERGVSLGQATSDLVLRGAESLPHFKTKNGWAVFDVPAGSPALTGKILDDWENADHEAEYQRALSTRR